MTYLVLACALTLACNPITTIAEPYSDQAACEAVRAQERARWPAIEMRCVDTLPRYALTPEQMRQWRPPAENDHHWGY